MENDLLDKPVSWAPKASVKEGSIVKPDGGFSCMREGDHLCVKSTENGDLYVDCDEGRHLIDPQLYGENKDHYIGLYLVEGK